MQTTANTEENSFTTVFVAAIDITIFSGFGQIGTGFKCECFVRLTNHNQCCAGAQVSMIKEKNKIIDISHDLNNRVNT